jgi:hypothetical protein
MPDLTEHFRLGEAMAVTAMDIPLDAYLLAKAADQALTKNAEYQRLLCHLGANVYRAADRGADLGCILLDKMASVNEWNDSLTPYSDAVLEAFAEEKLGGVGATAAGLISKIPGVALSNTPNAVLSLGALAALGGGSVGALGWLFNRHATEDDLEVEKTNQRAKLYENLAARINQNIKDRAPAQTAELL